MSARLVGFILAACLLAGCGFIGPAVGTPTSSLSGEIHADVLAVADAENHSSDRPYAEAGLDQTVPVGTTVYLDAFGSRAAEGDLVAHEWRIKHPNGTTTTPACPTCELTQFRPTVSGQYNVSLTVEDTAGRTASDTMYVSVLEESAPNATLSGPDQMRPNETAQIDLDAAAPVGKLAAVEWYVDGRYRRGRFLDTSSLDESLRFSPDSIGRHAIRAVVRDDNGTATRVRHTLLVRDPAPFEVEITDAADTVEAGQSWAPEFQVTNAGSHEDTQRIRLRIPSVAGSAVVDSETITLAPGETRQFDSVLSGGYDLGDPTLAWSTGTGAKGTHTAVVESATDSDTTAVEVGDPANFTVDITSIDAQPDELTVDVDVTNTGDLPDTQDIWHTTDPDRSYNDDLLESDLRLDGGDSTTLTAVVESVDYSQDDQFKVYSADDEDTGSIPDISTSGTSGSCGPNNCLSPNVVESADRSPAVGEFTTFGRVSLEVVGESWSQANWISATESEHPYDRVPHTMVASPAPGDDSSIDVSISGGNLAGFTPREPGTIVLLLSDSVSFKMYDSIHMVAQRGDPQHDGGEGEGSGDGPRG